MTLPESPGISQEEEVQQPGAGERLGSNSWRRARDVDGGKCSRVRTRVGRSPRGLGQTRRSGSQEPELEPDPRPTVRGAPGCPVGPGRAKEAAGWRKSLPVVRGNTIRPVEPPGQCKLMVGGGFGVPTILRAGGGRPRRRRRARRAPRPVVRTRSGRPTPPHPVDARARRPLVRWPRRPRGSRGLRQKRDAVPGA